MNDPVLQIQGLSLRRSERLVLDDVDLAVRRGELVAVMGPSGKTTLLRAIAGIEPFQSGRIALTGVVVGPGTPSKEVARAVPRNVGMVFQFHCLFEHLSALENVRLAPVHAYGVGVEAATARALELLRTFGVEHRAAALPRHLSGGEAQRVAIARALAVDPPVLLMDEPTASLDPARRFELGDLLRGLLAEGRTLVVATHDEDFARSWATRIVRIADGRLSE
jgi:ABC-type polar amino acid transport system ATPase subunit